jgi:signal transduction histidine kinase
VARLYDQTRHLSRLVKDLHDLAQAEAHELPLDCHPLDLVELVATTTELFAPLAEAEGVVLQVELPPSPITLTADRARLTQALQNLLANALRHTPTGGTIAVRVRPVGEGGIETVHLVVADTGIGVDPEHVPHLFERFYRTDRARSRDTGGTGLGLAIVKAIAVAHGGQVWVKSKGAGEGSRFVIALPLT